MINSDFIFGKYPEQLKLDFIKYGEKFIDQLINQKRYDLFDPLISDCECQLRAIWLCVFFKTKRHLEPLSNDDYLFFGLAKFLLDSAIYVDHEFCSGKCYIRTNLNYDCSQITSERFLARTFYGLAKSFVAERILFEIFNWFRELNYDDLIINESFNIDKKTKFQEILSFLENPNMTSYSDIPIPVVPTFISFIVFFSLSMKFGSVLRLNLVNIKNVDAHLICSGKSSFLFKYDKAIPEEFGNNYEDPVACINSYNYSNEISINDNLFEHLNKKNNFDASFSDYAYMVISGHPSLRLLKAYKNRANSEAISALEEKYRDLSKLFGIKNNKFASYLLEQETQSVSEILIEHTNFDLLHIRNS